MVSCQQQLMVALGKSTSRPRGLRRAVISECALQDLPPTTIDWMSTHGFCHVRLRNDLVDLCRGEHAAAGDDIGNLAACQCCFLRYLCGPFITDMRAQCRDDAE